MPEPSRGTPLRTGGFAAHVGPVHRLPGGTSFRLDMQPQHLNWAGRLHGGMMLSLHTVAMAEVAADLAAEGTPGRRAQLATLHADFMDSVPGRHQVAIEVDVAQARRSMAFLACRIVVAGRVVSRADAIYGFDNASAGLPASSISVGEPVVAPGWFDFAAREPGSRYLGPILDREPPADDGTWPERSHLGFHADTSRLDRDGVDVHDGLLLFVADIAGGRTAARANGGPCVTVSMQARRLGEAGVGTFVEHAPTLRRQDASMLVVEGDFVCGGRPVMSVSSVWKALPRA